LYWPSGWTTIDLFEEPMMLPDGLLFVASLVCLAAASLIQIRFYVFAGLAFLTLAEWRIANLFFDTQRPIWALTLLVAGLILTATVATLEIWHRRSRPWQEMD